MFHRFTATARRVMQRAFREAKRWQHDFVGTEHLLYGLLCDADGPAVMLLRTLGVDAARMLDKVELSLRRHDAGMAMEQFPLSPASQRVFQAALDAANRFHQQLIAPQHILVGLMRETDCEAAQILAADGVTLDALWSAVAALPADQEHEAKIRAEVQAPIPMGDNPSAADLEAWIAPPIIHDQEIDPSALVPAFAEPSRPLHEIEIQLHRTQLMLGAAVGYAFGHWLDSWTTGLLFGLIGLGLAVWRNIWVGILVGVTSGLFIAPLYHPDLLTPLGPVMLAALGAFLGSFLGDWRGPRVTYTVAEEEKETEAKE